MISLPSRDHVLFVIAILTGMIAIWAFIAPEALPDGLTPLYGMTADISPTWIAIITTGLLAAIVGKRLLTGITNQLDRSPIFSTPPEVPIETPVPEATGAFESTYTGVDAWFADADETGRRVAMYGRRANHHDDIPESVEQLLDELAITARDVHATTTNVDSEKAAQAVATGDWTDDRVAAAFLASDLDASPSFTAWERIAGWLAPQRTFESRMKRTVSAIEESAGAYLTYEKPIDEDSPARSTIQTGENA